MSQRLRWSTSQYLGGGGRRIRISLRLASLGHMKPCFKTKQQQDRKQSPRTKNKGWALWKAGLHLPNQPKENRDSHSRPMASVAYCGLHLHSHTHFIHTIINQILKPKLPKCTEPSRLALHLPLTYQGWVSVPLLTNQHAASCRAGLSTQSREGFPHHKCYLKS